MCKFYADAMLGKLSRFLRFLGYDTLYRTEETINDMLLISEKENRIIISQSKEVKQLCNKQDLRIVFLLDTEITQQLRQVREKVNVDFSFPPSKMRCSICNGDLLEKSKSDILDKIPEGTASNYDKFWECTKCSKIFWIGSHWEDIKKTINDINESDLNAN